MSERAGGSDMGVIARRFLDVCARTELAGQFGLRRSMASARTKTEAVDRRGSGQPRLLLAVCGRPKQEPVIGLPGRQFAEVSLRASWMLQRDRTTTLAVGGLASRFDGRVLAAVVGAS